MGGRGRRVARGTGPMAYIMFLCFCVLYVMNDTQSRWRHVDTLSIHLFCLCIVVHG